MKARMTLPTDRRPKIKLAITDFSAGEFQWQPALSDNTVVG